MASTLKPLLVVAGVGNGTGTGASTARLFAKQGYSVALIARGADSLQKLASEINSSGGGGDAHAFPAPSYSALDIHAIFTQIFTHYPASTHSLRVALFNVSQATFKTFLNVTPEDVEATLTNTIGAAFAFSREVILKFKENGLLEGVGSRGTLIFTGATASLRGNVMTSAFAAGKFGLRALSQSLAKEFGKENIHVVHSIIDGPILTDHQRHNRNNPEWEANENARLDPDAIAAAYLYAVGQHRSAWTWELDLRPAHEKW